jgi:hypothetical protein
LHADVSERAGGFFPDPEKRPGALYFVRFGVILEILKVPYNLLPGSISALNQLGRRSVSFPE